MKKIISVILSICLMFAAGACNLIVKNSDESQFDYPVTVGNVVFDKAPENVVVLSDNLADIILACGYEGKLAARSDSCTQDGLEVLPSVGTPDSPDINKLRDLNTVIQGLPGGPVVRTLCFHCRGHGFSPWSGN